MAKNKITKEDLKSPDAFISFADRAGRWMADRAKPLAVSVGVVVVLAVGYTALNLVQSGQEKSASAAMFAFEKKITDVKMEHAKKQRDLIEKLSEEDKADEDKVAEVVKTVEELDFDKDFAANAKAWSEAIEQYGSTKSAQLARIRLARLYLDYKKTDLAEPVLRAAVENSEKGTSTYGLSRTMLASVLSFQNKVPEARDLLQQVMEDPSLAFMHSEVLLKMGVLNKEAGDLKLAEEMFRRVTTEFADTQAGEAAKLYLRLIRLMSPQVQTENSAKSVNP